MFFYQERLRREIQTAPASPGRINAADPHRGFAAVGVSVGGTDSADGTDSRVGVGGADSASVGNIVSVGYSHGVGGSGVAVRPR